LGQVAQALTCHCAKRRILLAGCSGLSQRKTRGTSDRISLAMSTPRVQAPSSTVLADARPWASAARPVLAWAVPALLSLSTKYHELRSGRGFRVVAQYLGRTETINSTGFSFLEKLSFFRADILIVCVLFPLLLLILARFLPRRWRIPVLMLLTVAASLALFIQFRALQEVGRFVSFDMLVTAARWATWEHGVTSTYGGAMSLLPVLAGVAWMIGVASWSARKQKEEGLGRIAASRMRFVARLVMATVLILAALACISRLPATPYHRSAFFRALAAYEERVDADTREFAGLTMDELVEHYRSLTQAPPPRRDARYWGKARGYNVLFLVFETAPASFLPAGDALADMPNLQRLRENSFVAERHYSTYPYTDRAAFSLFSSWYPSGLMKGFEQQHPNMIVPGLPRLLAPLGYETAYYEPYNWRAEPEEEMFHAMGFQHAVFPDAASFPRPPREDGSQPEWKAVRIARDLAALRLLERDLAGWLGEKRPFVTAVLPQAGHIPWPDSDADARSKTFPQRGRAMLAMQDAWLGELLSLLEQHGQLTNTLIVVVGDHGVRSRQEDPNFASGMLDDYAFHVPLMIYAPRVLDHTERISWLTSHIDVAPTLLDLLGVEQGREFEQGSAIWNSDLQKRATFFLGRHLLGADGYYAGGNFFMWNYMSDAAYAGRQLHFDPAQVLVSSSPAAAEVRRTISRLVALQEIWAQHFASGQLVRGALSAAPSR
jgi:arylsulfatase A-like enzyme